MGSDGELDMIGTNSRGTKSLPTNCPVVAWRSDGEEGACTVLVRLFIAKGDAKVCWQCCWVVCRL